MQLLNALLAFAPSFVGDGGVLAYLDPGTGSLIFQVFVASLVSAAVVFGRVVSHLHSFFSRIVLRRPSVPSTTDSRQTSEGATIESAGAITAESSHERSDANMQKKAA